MAKTRLVVFRVTPAQHERIRNKAHAKGYKTIASFIRHLALENDLVFEQKFEEMYKVICRKNR